MRLQDFLELKRLAQQRLRSEADYRTFQSFQAQELCKYLAAHRIVIRGRSLLDLGSGLAGFSHVFAQRGAQVISLDLVVARYLGVDEFSQVRASALAVPLREEAVDLVFCASLIEHVADPALVLSEIERVLRVGGYCYVSFPPYYSPLGGHEFSPFHYLGERLAMRLVRRHRVVPEWVYQFYNLPEQPSSFANLSQGWGLYKMTIRKFHRLVAGTKLVCVNMSTRYLPVSFVRWPLLGEILTWHAQFILVKAA